MKGVFNVRPPRPRYSATWDVDIVINFLKIKPYEDLTLKELTLKLTMLMALSMAARPQTLNLLTLQGMIKNEEEIILQVSENLKHNRPSKPMEVVKIKRFPQDESVCVYTALNIYLQKTENLRTTDGQLLISFIKPNKPVSRDTVCRWIRTVMNQAGIDTERYGAYNTRSAAVSKASSKKLSTKEILDTAGWSRESTFSKFYHKSVERNENFQEVILTT